MDSVSLIDHLRAAGATVEPTGEVSQPFFSAKGQVITVNGDNVQVFEYADTAAANAEATLVSPDGGSVGTNIMAWVATPHFYKTGRLIVLYVGDHPAVINVLETVLGPQFAGGEASGIIGKVLIGPQCPVIKLGMEEQCQDKPYQATVIIKTEDGLREITQFSSDSNGEFRVVLEPGTYLLEPLLSGFRFPRAGPEIVTVETGQFTEITILYDTGIR
ncbi:MAG: hypothetical protein ACE5JP_14185 [Candidatus Bipolaricaulia bacterium]